jgi:hypothetical protein
MESAQPRHRWQSYGASDRAARNAIAVVLCAFLASCGGGSGGSGAGGGNGGTATGTISYSATQFHFAAAKPYSPTPANQMITATVSGVTSGTLYITVVENNPDIVTVDNVVAANTTSGQATLIPGTPSHLLAGSHQGTLTIRACLNDPSCASGQLNGSPQTITVEYDIGSTVDADTLTPRVVQSNVAGKITLRGHGFAIGDAVTIGATAIPISSVSYYSDSDMVVSYPPLAAGTYPIAINAGGVSYSTTLTVVDPTAFPATFLSYPAITPTAIQSLEYDGQRNALFVLLATGGQPVLLRYAFDGSNWSSPTMASTPGMQQVHLSPDGTKLLALISIPTSQLASIAELDPITLSQTANTALPSSVAGIQAAGSPDSWFSLANDGNALVVLNSAVITGPATEGFSEFAFLFGTSSRVFSLLPIQSTGLVPIAAVSSGDGNIVEFGYEYNASGGTVSGFSNLPLGGFGSSGDLSGDKFVMPNPYSTLPGVYSSGVDSPMGYLPATEGAVINSAGTRVYVIEQTQLDSSPDLHIFDSSAAASVSVPNYPELTPDLPLAGDPGISSSLAPLLTISTDSGTVFVAGANGIAVQPVPP